MKTASSYLLFDRLCLNAFGLERLVDMYNPDADENRTEKGKYIAFGRAGNKNGKQVAGGNIIHGRLI